MMTSEEGWDQKTRTGGALRAVWGGGRRRGTEFTRRGVCLRHQNRQWVRLPIEQITTAVRGHAVCRGSRHLPNDFGGKVCPLCSGAAVRNRSSFIHRQ